MERWAGRVALVTGASAGIGAAVAKELVLRGMKVIAVARRVERVEEVPYQLQALQEEMKGASGTLYPFAGDVSKEADILAVFEWAAKNVGGVDVLINNAGLGAHNASLAKGNTENWRNIFDINVIGLSMCSREAIKSMQARGVNDGHIINVGSNLGHKVADVPGIGMYAASKFSVRALTEALRGELNALNSRIKVTSLSPGLVRTEFGSPDKSNPNFSIYDNRPHLVAQNLVDSIVYILGTPENVQVTELWVLPVGQTT